MDGYIYPNPHLQVKCNTRLIFKWNRTVLNSVFLPLDNATWVQIIDKAFCIPCDLNTLGKGINPISLPQTMSE